MVNTLVEPTAPLYTLATPFSRLWLVKPFFEAFRKLELDYEQTELIFYCDSLYPELSEFVTIEALRLVEKGFAGITVIWEQNGEQTNRPEDSRYRICTIHEHLKQYIHAPIFMMLEDDTVVPPNTFYELLTYYMENPRTHFIQAIEVGRRAWRNYGSWSQIGETIFTDAPNTGIKPIVGGGFYAFVTDTETYKAHDFHSYKDTIYEPFGCDFWYVKSLTEHGYEAYTNWDLHATHLHFKNGEIKRIEYEDANIQGFYTREGDKWLVDTKPINEN